MSRPILPPKTFTQRAECDEADTQLLERRQLLPLRPPPPKGIFALQGNNRLHRVRTADGGPAGFGKPEVLELAFADQVAFVLNFRV